MWFDHLGAAENIVKTLSLHKVVTANVLKIIKYQFDMFSLDSENSY